MPGFLVETLPNHCTRGRSALPLDPPAGLPPVVRPFPGPAAALAFGDAPVLKLTSPPVPGGRRTFQSPAPGYVAVRSKK